MKQFHTSNSEYEYWSPFFILQGIILLFRHRVPDNQMEGTQIKQKHMSISPCFHLLLAGAMKLSCESNENRSENLAPIQANIKLIKKSKPRRQSDGLIHKKNGNEKRTELTNNICLWSVFSRWTFDRCLKNFIFTQHRSENDINIKLHKLFPVFIFSYIGSVFSILLFWHMLMWLSGERVHSLTLPLSKRGVLNLNIYWQIVFQIFHFYRIWDIMKMTLLQLIQQNYS